MSLAKPSFGKEICPVCIGAKVIFIGNQQEAEEEIEGMNGKECNCPKCNGEGCILVEDYNEDESQNNY